MSNSSTRSISEKIATHELHAHQQRPQSICQRCNAQCCYHARPPLTKARQRIIQRYLTNQRTHNLPLFEQKHYTFPRETSDGRCIFLNPETHQCRIHCVKPETCIAGPITFDMNTTTNMIEWYLKQSTICPLAGYLAQNPQMIHLHLARAKTAIQRLIRQLSATELASILQIDEPETFQIAETPLAHTYTTGGEKRTEETT